ncbi:MAG: hypothetical protein ACM3SS_11090 [Rhodospirillaceae bacterium]
MRLRTLLVAVGLAWTAAAGAQEHKLMPVDEAAKDPSWVSFKNRLLDALQKRDRKFLLSVTDRNVRNTTAGERGIAEFQRQWDLASETSPLWRELSSALFLGAAYMKPDKDEKGRKGRQELCAPYVLAKWPEDIEPFGHGAIVARDTAVKKEPSSGSPTLQSLSYDIVPVLDWEMDDREPGSPQRWVKVRTAAGDGYVPEEHVRSPIELAACFVKGPNGWRMVAFAPAGGG